MKKYFQLEPEVSGEFGENTKIDNSIHPPKIENLEFIFKGWLGDCIIECFPVFLITEKVLLKLDESKLNGFSIKKATIVKDYSLDEIQPNLNLPRFIWIDINGTPKKSDFGIENNLLIVSEKVLEILKSEGLNYCEIEKK